MVFGKLRLAITGVLDTAMITSINAGQPVRHRLWVEIEDKRRCELERTLPDGEWRVRFEVPSDAGADADG